VIKYMTRFVGHRQIDQLHVSFDCLIHACKSFLPCTMVHTQSQAQAGPYAIAESNPTPFVYQTYLSMKLSLSVFSRWVKVV